MFRRMEGKTMRHGRAIVIGGSMGGLLAARALADFFEQVTIVERDSLPPMGEQRKGVPQGRHTHALLPRGSQVLEGLFPGLTDDLVRMGVPQSTPADFRWFDGGGYHCRFGHDGGAGLLVSRPLLEGYVRRRLLALPNVTIIEQCDALGLMLSESGERVTGVRILRRAAGSAEEVLEADIVVDAAGRGSRAAAWLEELGYPRPEEEQVTVRFGYMTRLYRRRPDDLEGAKVVVIGATPETKRAGVMLAQEGDRWTLSLAGFAGDYPPADEEGFLAFARSLPAPDIYEVIKNAEPLSDFVPYRFPASLRRRYERLARFPEGFLLFGDSICSFNPIYGQGMTVAALEALDLQRTLAEGREGLARRFFRRAAKTIDTPWQIAVGNDLRFPEVEGERTAAVRFINWYLSKVHVAARRDPAVARAFSEVAGLLAPPPSLMRPGIILRVLLGNLRPATRTVEAPGADIVGPTVGGKIAIPPSLKV